MPFLRICLSCTLPWLQVPTVVRDHCCLSSKSQMLQHHRFLLAFSLRQDLWLSGEILLLWAILWMDEKIPVVKERSRFSWGTLWQGCGGHLPSVVGSFSALLRDWVDKSCLVLWTNSQQCLFCCHAELTGFHPGQALPVRHLVLLTNSSSGLWDTELM